MQRLDVKISRERKKLRIIRSEKIIDEELDLYRSRMALRESFSEKEIPGLKDEIESLKKEIEEKEKKVADLNELADEIKDNKPAPTWYVKEFVIRHDEKPIDIDMSRIVEDSVPISVAKEEIQLGYERGQEDGQLMAMATYKSEIEKYQEWIKQIDSVVDTFKKDYISKVQRFEESLMELSILIAEQILNTEIEKDKSVVVSQVRKAIASIYKERIFRIHIHPEVYSLLEEVKSTLLEDENLSNQIELYPDMTVPVGGCLIDTSAGLIDARVTSQLRQIRDALHSEESVILDEEEARMHEDNIQEMMRNDDSFEMDSNQASEEEIPEDFSYDDVPPEYKDMIDPEIFGQGDLDPDGNPIPPADEEDEEQVEESEEIIDYEQILEEDEKQREENKLRDQLREEEAQREDSEQENDNDDNDDSPDLDIGDRNFDF